MEDYITDTSDLTIHISYKCDNYMKINSKRQNIKIVDTIDFGNALFLDNCIQSTERDEYIYHETMVHTLLMDCPNIKRVLILGGSEGCISREVLKYKEVEEIIQVDWDDMLVSLYKGDYSYINNGAYKDNKVKIYYEDAFEFLKKDGSYYDAIFVDLLDPKPDTLNFFKELFDLAFLRLNDGGGIIANVGSVSPINRTCADDLADWLKPKLERRIALKIYVPSFMQPWCFLGGLPRERIYRANPETKYFDENTLKKASYWSKDYSSSLKNFSDI